MATAPEEGAVGGLIHDEDRGCWEKLSVMLTREISHGSKMGTTGSPFSVMHRTIGNAELHWYEAHGIGKKEFKIKRLLA